MRYPDADRTLPELVERRARAEPDRVALISDEGALTFGELYRRALAVAAAVRRAGAGPGAVVGICAERSPELVAGVLGAQFAGAAYLPLEPSLPVARLALMAREAGATVVLTRRQDSATAEQTGARHVVVLDSIGYGGTAKRVPVSGTDPAYVIYTSGSTGRPKGVIDHPPRRSSTACCGCRRRSGSTPATGCCRRPRSASTCRSGSSSGRC